MDIKKNQKKINELVDAFVNDEESFYKVTQEYINQISYNIGEAISPLNDLAVPFVVFALQSYADALRKGDEEHIDSIVKSLAKGSKSAVVSIPIKRGYKN